MSTDRRGKNGAACELFVRADLCRRGLEVTVPDNHSAKHDVHAKFPSIGWRGLQVKAAYLKKKSGLLRASSPKRDAACKSPILALVHLDTWRIDYLPGTDPVPEELRGDL